MARSHIRWPHLDDNMKKLAKFCVDVIINFGLFVVAELARSLRQYCRKYKQADKGLIAEAIGGIPVFGPKIVVNGL